MRKFARRRAALEQERTESSPDEIGFLGNRRRRESLFSADVMAIMEWRSQSRVQTESPQIYLHSPTMPKSRGGDLITTSETNLYK